MYVHFAGNLIFHSSGHFNKKKPVRVMQPSKESLVHNEASKANLNAYKRIMKWQPLLE